jgi:hypothetical protein
MPSQLALAEASWGQGSLHCLDAIIFTVPGVLVEMAQGYHVEENRLVFCEYHGPLEKQVPVLIMPQHYNILIPHPDSIC